jgi:hypothetical protein
MAERELQSEVEFSKLVRSYADICMSVWAMRQKKCIKMYYINQA